MQIDSGKSGSGLKSRLWECRAGIQYIYRNDETLSKKYWDFL